ncbi:MAG TPA: argininosuccinate lyase [Acidobacteriota bacterium]|jgi:argininosuccinate lyase|nr:argininosuccinate lyase [Acidobacteriota bacterium]
MTSQKLWANRFQSPLEEIIDNFTRSSSFDRKLWRYDLQGSCAHVLMLEQQGLLNHSEAEQLLNGISFLHKELMRCETENDWKEIEKHEDIHSFVEFKLKEMFGHVADKLHTGRSRNDQVAVDSMLYLRDQLRLIDWRLRDVQRALLTAAKRDISVTIPAYTHLQRAQLVSLAHYWLALYEMFHRDRLRLKDLEERLQFSPLGSGAIAGSTLPIDRKFTAKVLGFHGPSANSIDTVGDRDWLLEFLSDAAILMTHISRLCEDLILWCSSEFNFIRLEDSLCTGSSLMPHKKNPDALELMRGKTAGVVGNLMSALTLMKGLPSGYSRDMQEDKIFLFQAAETVLAVLPVLERVIRGVSVNEESVTAASADPLLLATDLAEYLVSHGVAFREAHSVVGRMVQEYLKTRRPWQDWKLEEFHSHHLGFQQDVFDIFMPDSSLLRKKTLGSPNPDFIRKKIQELDEELQQA